MKKKILLSLIIIMLLFLVTTGCSSSTSSGSSYESYSKCQFKNSNGTQTCTNKATHGQLCEYHYNYLNDIYNSYTN